MHYLMLAKTCIVVLDLYKWEDKIKLVLEIELLLPHLINKI
jgi:hypothetical protein